MRNLKKHYTLLLTVTLVSAIAFITLHAIAANTDQEHEHGPECSHATAEQSHQEQPHQDLADADHDHDEHAAEESANNDEHADHDHELINEDDHEDHSETSDHGHEEHDDSVHLDKESEKFVGIKTVKAAKGSISSVIRLTGKIQLNDDRLSHIVPQVRGVVKEVKKTFGDTVKKGELMAVISSRELSDVKASYLAAIQRYELARGSFEREKKLWDSKISSEQDYLSSKTAFAEAEINRMIADQKLRALGFSEEYLERLPTEPKDSLTKYEITAPFDGTVISKHISLGEVVNDESSVFTVADLSTVWVDLDVFPKDLLYVQKGQKVNIKSGDYEVSGVIGFVSPILNPETATATARVIMESENGILKPGMFITALASGKEYQAGIVVPKESLQTLEGKHCVFVKQGEDYKPQFVVAGRQGIDHIEIISGLNKGQEVVTKGAFDLKAKIVTSTLDSHAGHGH